MVGRKRGDEPGHRRIAGFNLRVPVPAFRMARAGRCCSRSRFARANRIDFPSEMP